MADLPRMGAAPRNLDYYLQRMTGYSKNTIKLLPSSKYEYNANDTVMFRLPTNSVLDLHTLNLKMSAQITQTTDPGATTNAIAFPRYTQSFIRRLDVNMGGIQTGLGSLTDYGFLYYLLASHKVPISRSEMDLAVTDLAFSPDKQEQDDSHPGAYPHFWNLDTKQTSDWVPLSISSWLGILGGSFMRFLDTNICPDIQISISLAPDSVLAATHSGAVYQMRNLSLTVESISFGDGSYRAMVDARMAGDDPLLVPFYNWSGYEGSSSVSNISTQFTIGTESLNALIATIRPGNYDALTLPNLGGRTGRQYIPQVGPDPDASTAPITRSVDGYYNWYQTALSGEKCMVDAHGPDARWTSNYQFVVDSKLYPQFLADVHDSWHLLKNMYDANALSLHYGSSISTLDQFTQAVFAFCVGLDHHADDQGKDHLISGLNTTGSLVPITWNTNMSNDSAWWAKLKTMCGGSFRPTVFANLTSTLMIYKGRTIAIVT